MEQKIPTDLLPPQITSFDEDTWKKINEFKNSEDAKKYLTSKHDEHFITRYLRARKYDVNQAVQMFVQVIEWKKEMNVDSIKENFPQNPHYQKLIDYWPGSLHWDEFPTSKDGSLVLLQALGRVDPAVIESVGSENLIQFHIWCMEKLEARYWETVEKVGYWPGFIMIEDLQGLGYHTFSSSVLKVLQQIVKINQNYYPEILRKMYILNVPSFFYMFWKGISVWMEPRSVAKMELIHGNVQSVADKFSVVFDLTTLPGRLGGTSAKDIPLGGLLSNTVQFKEPPQNQINISRGSKHELKFNVKTGDTYSYEFKTEEYEIAFSITLHISKKSKEVLKANERVEASKSVIQGTVEITADGELHFVWDNSSSWIKPKSVSFNIYKGTELLKV